MDSEMIMIIAVVAIGCVTGLISSWMNKRYKDTNIDEENFNRLAKAFVEYKKEMTKRVENLEAIIADNENSNDFEQLEAPEEDRTLRNDLQQKNKDRVKS
jgi:uncharacterized membrane protein (DUF106 family)